MKLGSLTVELDLSFWKRSHSNKWNEEKTSVSASLDEDAL